MFEDVCVMFGMRRRLILLFVVISVWSYAVTSAIHASFIVGGSNHRTYNKYYTNPSTLATSIANIKPSTYLLQHVVESSTTITATTNPLASTTTNIEFGSDQHIPPTLMRCPSFDAAEIIRNCTTNNESLLIITCDASGRGGGSKHDGIASILRVRNGLSYLSNETTSTLQSTTTNEKVDLIDVIARRTIPSRTSSEVAAISLGIRRAMSRIPQTMRWNVLILSDSEFALDFYCKESEHKSLNNDHSIPKRRAINNKQQKKKKGRKQITPSMESRDEAHRRSLIALIKETPSRILLSKIRSSSRGIGMTSTNTNGDNKDDEDASWNGIGFIDHDAADHLSSIIRSIPNSRDDEEKKAIDMSNAVKPLGESDLRWLENSESDTSDNDEGSVDGFWKTMNSMGSDARSDRKERSKRRTLEIEQMLGI